MCQRSKVRLGIASLAGSLLAIPVAATGSPYTHAEYSVRVSAVTTFGEPMGVVASASDEQDSFLAQPATSQVGGQADYGTISGFGYANGHAMAKAESGVLRAFASAESQAEARPDSNVGSGAVSTALAEFADELTFTPAHSVYQDLLIINGELILTGDLYGSGYLLVAVGGTGLAQSTAAEWIGEMGQQKSPGGVYSPWTPGDPVAIPFSFTVYANQAERDRLLAARASGQRAELRPLPRDGRPLRHHPDRRKRRHVRLLQYADLAPHVCDGLVRDGGRRRDHLELGLRLSAPGAGKRCVAARRSGDARSDAEGEAPPALNARDARRRTRLAPPPLRRGCRCRFAASRSPLSPPCWA